MLGAEIAPFLFVGSAGEMESNAVRTYAGKEMSKPLQLTPIRIGSMKPILYLRDLLYLSDTPVRAQCLHTFWK